MRRKIKAQALWVAAATAALLFLSRNSWAQTPSLPAGLTEISGRDAASDIAYVRLSLAAEKSAAASSGESSPALTMECTEANKRRRIDIYFDFGDADRSFHPPPPPDPITHFPPRNPSARLSLSFEGYKTFKDSWEMMPSHEYRYRAPAGGSPNMEPVSFLLRYMYSVPVVRISYTDRKLDLRVIEFHTGNLIAEMNRTPLCQP